MSPLLLLILQVAVILATARVVGLLFRRIGQPQVVGEMVAGIVLGPSLLGWAAPAVFATLFPPDSLGALNALSQIGLLAFMFLVGLEFDPARLRGRGDADVLTSHASIIAPFLLGSVLALLLYPRLSDASVPFAGVKHDEQPEQREPDQRDVQPERFHGRRTARPGRRDE